MRSRLNLRCLPNRCERRSLRLQLLEPRRLLASDPAEVLWSPANAPEAAHLNPAAHSNPVGIEQSLESEHSLESAAHRQEDISPLATALEIKAAGISLYAAAWCPNCIAQKEWFGSAADSLPIIELSNRDGTPNLIAITSGIQSTPTWRVPLREDLAVSDIRFVELASRLSIPSSAIRVQPSFIDIGAVLSPDQTRVLLNATQEIRALNRTSSEKFTDLALLDDHTAGSLSTFAESAASLFSDTKLPSLHDAGQAEVFPDLIQLGHQLRAAQVMFYGQSGEMFTRAQERFFGNAADAFPRTNVLNHHGDRTPAAIAAGIEHRPTWRFPGQLGDRLPVIIAASDSLNLGVHLDQWQQQGDAFHYVGILRPAQIAAAAGVRLQTLSARDAIEQLADPADMQLADALRQSGAQFFGAHWCGVCQTQKSQFGAASALLPYVETAQADGRPNDLARRERIEVFPTWRFPLAIAGRVESVFPTDTISASVATRSRVTINSEHVQITGRLENDQLRRLVGLAKLETPPSPDRMDIQPSLISFAEGEETSRPHRNPFHTFDVNNDAQVTALDALIVVNHLGRTGGGGTLPTDGPDPSSPIFLDVSGDGSATALDALRVINELGLRNSRTPFLTDAPDLLFRFSGSQIVWQDGFDENSTDYLVGISTQESCRSDFVFETEVSGQQNVEVPSSIGMGSFYVCLRSRSADGIVREPINNGIPLEVRGIHRVFATGGRFSITTGQGQISGSFGNIAGADFNCNDEAFGAGLLPDWDFTSAIWKAVISDSNEVAYDRLAIQGGLFNMQDERLAIDKDDFFDNELEVPIRYNANGLVTTVDSFWHGTGDNGRFTANNCDDWSPDGGSAATGGTHDTMWLTGGPNGRGDCNSSSEALVCVSPLMPPLE